MPVNTITRNYVPAFLLGMVLLIGAACGRGASGDRFSPDEEFFIEQYLRIVEARQLAAASDSLAEGRFAWLETSLPADSLRAIAARISADSPRRWAPIFEEIVRRKRIMETELR